MNQSADPLSRRAFGVIAGSLAAASPAAVLNQAASAERPLGSSTFGRAKRAILFYF